MRPLPREVFESLVADALDEVPPELMALRDNVVVLVEDRNPDEPDLLGLYEGHALTERGWQYGGDLPDRIMIYREAICEICSTAEEVVEEARENLALREAEEAQLRAALARLSELA